MQYKIGHFASNWRKSSYTVYESESGKMLTSYSLYEAALLKRASLNKIPTASGIIIRYNRNRSQVKEVLADELYLVAFFLGAA